MSASTLRSRSTPDARIAAMRRLYETPASRDAALMRAIHSARNCDFRLRRSRNAYVSACIAASRAGRTSFRFVARRPSAALRSRLCFLCAATPRFTRDICLLLVVGQELANELDVALRHERLTLVPALAPRRLVLGQLPFVRLHPRELPRARHAEPLLRTAVASDLGHGVTSSEKDVRGNCTAR